MVGVCQVWVLGGGGGWRGWAQGGIMFSITQTSPISASILGSKIILAPHTVSVSGTDYLLC